MAQSRYVRLAEKVLDAALDSGLRRGDRLAEQAMARSCGVSRTPIRAALKMLQEQGLVTRSPEGGAILACDPETGISRLSSDHRAPDDRLGERIIRDRAARRLGRAVTITDLIRRYDAPRSAVQNALDALRDQGVVQKAEGQSWTFTRLPNDGSARKASFEFRLVLEPQAILSDGFRLDPKRAAAVRSQTETLLARGENTMTAAEFRAADLYFHKLIARSAGNPFMSEALLAHHGLRQLSSDMPDLNDFRMRQALEEHLRILAHLEQEQFELAADLMRVHLRLSATRRPSLANRGAPAGRLAISDAT